jgi:hypothetical protein
MSRELLDLSPDLLKLRNEGFEIAIRQNYVVITNVPYLNSEMKVDRATLVAKLIVTGDRAGIPDNHVMSFAGSFPYRAKGEKFSNLGGPGAKQILGEGLIVNFQFSQKPASGKYANYYDKFTSYIAIFENEAKVIDSNVTAKTFRIVESEKQDSIFYYPDTNSSRAEINLISNKLRGAKIGIVGLGGTGSYVLDFVAKTPVEEIHLFDADEFLAHNAFRSPGAPTREELNAKQLKVLYFRDIYSKMRNNIMAHEEKISEKNISKLDLLDFVFICIDQGFIKPKIFKRLESLNINFIDVGMGLGVENGAIDGIIRTTASTDLKRNHIYEKKLVSLQDDEDADEYSTNIQIAELNCFNAAMAVIKWKKTLGFYVDTVKDHSILYSIGDNNFHCEDEA